MSKFATCVFCGSVVRFLELQRNGGMCEQCKRLMTATDNNEVISREEESVLGIVGMEDPWLN